MEMKKKKNILLGILAIVGILSITIGVSVAFFNYTRTGGANTIRVGRISFVTRQTKTISLTNLFPIDPTNSEEMSDATKVGTLEIEIEGDTDYNKGVEYLVSSTNTHITTSTGKLVPISLSVTPTNLGTENVNYFTAREDKNATIYKKLVGDTLVGDQMLLVGFIKPNTTSGTIEGVNGKLTIKAYLDENKILISDTYDGTESDNMGTPNSLAQGKTILTTTEWNSLSTSGISFQIKVEANEGIWVNNTLDNIIRTKNLSTTTNQPIMDNVASKYVTASTGINFGAVSSDTNGKGVYMRAGTENDAYPIVYYRGAVEDNNVVFNNKCWKAVRTTDTGGVKLIYNGESSAIYDDVPLTESQYTIPSGATNNFTFNSTDNSWEISITDNSAKEISFTVPAGNGYKLVQTGTSGSSTGGTWTYYKDGSNVHAYGNGGGQPMNDTYEFGTLTSSNVIKWTYTGSSSAESPITFKLQMQGRFGELVNESGCDNSGIDTHISISATNMFAFNTSHNSPAYVGYMYGTVYESKQKQTTATMKFGSGFTYSRGTYTLTNAEDGIANTRHYTCFTTNDTCDGADVGKVYYVYYKSGNYYYYIELENGKSVEDAIAEMQTNTTSSNAKTQIESWYASNMASVTNKLEDTIWCNDRSTGNGNNNGWIANGGYTYRILYYGAHERSNYADNTSTVKNQPSLSCANKNDAFTVSNGKGNQKLIYPVALLTADEIVLAGGLGRTTNTNYYLATGNTYWTLSPYMFGGIYDEKNACIFDVIENGYISGNSVDMAYGLRPSISLKPGLPVIKGTGTVIDPYVIE